MHRPQHVLFLTGLMSLLIFNACSLNSSKQSAWKIGSVIDSTKIFNPDQWNEGIHGDQDKYLKYQINQTYNTSLNSLKVAISKTDSLGHIRILEDMTTLEEKGNIFESLVASKFLELGRYYKSQYMIENCISAYKNSIHIKQKYLPITHHEIMSIYGEMGIAETYYNGNIDSGLVYLLNQQRSFVGNSNPKEQYSNYYALASNYRIHGEFTLANIYIKKAIQACMAQTPIDSLKLGNAYAVLGNIHYESYEYEDSKESFDKSISLIKSLNSRHRSLLRIYRNYVLLMINQGYLEESKDIIDAIQEIDSGIYWTAESYRLKGLILFKTGNRGDALALFNKVIILQNQYEIYDIDTFLDLLRSISYYYSEHGEFSKALECVSLMDSILVKNNINKDHEYFAYVSSYKGKVLVDTSIKNHDKKIEEEGLQLLLSAEQLFFNKLLSFENFAKWINQDAFFDNYQFLIDFYIKKFQSDKDFKNLRLCLNYVEKRKKNSSLNINPLLENHLSSLRQDLRKYHTLNRINEGIYSDSIIKTIQKTKEILEIDQIKSLNNSIPPLLSDNSNVISFDALSKLTNDKNILYLNFNWTKKFIHNPYDNFVIGVNGQQIELFIYKDPASIEHLIKKWIGILKSKKDLTADNYELSHQLFKLLLEPIMAKFPNVTTLIINGQGLVKYLPFESLIVAIDAKDLEFSMTPLLESKMIVYTNSVSEYIKKSAAPKEYSRLLNFSFSDKFSIKNSTLHSQYPELPGTYLEYKSIAEVWNRSKFIGFAGKDATKDNFLFHAPQYDVIHLAMHGKSDLNDPFLNKLIFRDESLNCIPLYPYELSSISLSEPLVVLSSCETALGKSYQEEGILSWAKTFSEHGASAIICSLWNADDQYTPFLMKDFYQLLIRTQDPTASLHFAKIALAKHYGPNAIKYWSPIVIYQ